MAPQKGEETETQRSVRARHLRSIRRSTQGITSETLEQAKAMAGTPATGEADNGSSTSQPTPDSTKNDDDAQTAKGSSTTSTTPTSSFTTRRMARLRAEELAAENDKASSKDNQSAPYTTRSWRDKFNKELADSTTDGDSSSRKSSGGGSTSTPYRRSARDRVPTGKINLSDIEEASKIAGKRLDDDSSISSSPHTQSNNNNSTTSNSAISSSYSTSSASSRPPPTRYTSRYTAPPSVQSSSTNGSYYGTSSSTGGACSSAGGASSTSGSYSSVHGRSPTSPTARYSSSPAKTTTAASLPSSRYNSSSWRESTVDYRRLYEEEKLEKERLKSQLDSMNRQISDLRLELSRVQPSQGLSSSTVSDSDGMQWRLQQYEDQLKDLSSLREQNAKMKEENGALIRVISKLSRPA